ncbi:prepilin-type N-terminal cleavage/methylation domain-containing protein [Roseateles sp.]|uniref:prepilin-type N-terminal cleavage/methylation domain-containing protein n=1 Tax=Roseateles sp. TaxID=1971397 RepID=UPI002F40914E
MKRTLHLRTGRGLPAGFPKAFRQRSTRGFTLIEFMIGLTIGLLLLAGALSMAGIQLGEHRRLMLELQVQQELRATAELILRDLRRAAFWDRAQDGVWQDDPDTPVRNPYTDLTVEDSGRRVSYSFARDGTAPGGASVRETSGLRLSDGRLDQLIAGRYQPLTDPDLLRVRQLQVQLASQGHPLGDACATACLSAASGCAPTLSTRLVTLTVEAEAVHDPRVSHRLELISQLHNHAMSGDCP